MNRIEILKKTKLFVLDMDGTFYLGEHVLDGALDFISSVKKAGKDFIFFRNLPTFSTILFFLQIIHQNHRSCILKNLLKWVASSVAKK